MRRCKSCRIEKPETDFYEAWYTRQDGTKGRTGKCKPCTIKTSAKQQTGPSRDGYLAYQKDYRLTHKKEKRKDRLNMLAWMDGLKNKPCLDCGRTFPPECMDFDHINPATKSFTISYRVVSCGCKSEKAKETILAEIAKCRLICANCHRIRTAKQHRRGLE